MAMLWACVRAAWKNKGMNGLPRCCWPLNQRKSAHSHGPHSVFKVDLTASLSSLLDIASSFMMAWISLSGTFWLVGRPLLP